MGADILRLRGIQVSACVTCVIHICFVDIFQFRLGRFMHRSQLPDNIWDGMFVKLVTINETGEAVREWRIFDEGRLIATVERKDLVDRAWIRYKCGGK